MYKYYLLQNNITNEVFFYKINFKNMLDFYNDLKLFNLNLNFMSINEKQNINIDNFIKIKNFYRFIIIIDMIKYNKDLKITEYLLEDNLTKEDFLKKYV